MKQKWLEAYMDMAERFAQLSTAKRLQCGAVIVKDNRIISIGYNGTPTGWSNECEEEIEDSHERDSTYAPTTHLVTKPEVLHAERNALDKIATSNESSEGATMFSTHSPCLECAKSIFNTKIKTLYYRTDYRDQSGILFLRKCGVEVNKI